MKIFWRLRLETGCYLLINPEHIIDMQVCEAEEGGYLVTISTLSKEFIVDQGTYDYCHNKLNKLSNMLDAKLIDI